MIMPIPIRTNSCPCCAEDMPAWVTIIVLSIIAFLIIIAIPIWCDIAKSVINMWKEFIDDIKWNIKHGGDK